jgi:hypothetical protein
MNLCGDVSDISLLNALRDDRVGYGLDDCDSIPDRGRDFFSLRHRVQTGS